MGKYFTIQELSRSAVAKSNGIDNTPSLDTEKRMRSLIANLLDPIREAWGKPLIVNSGYRCVELNRKVGGATKSQHLLGEAADITAGSPEANLRLFKLIAASGLDFDQLIDEKGYAWIHVSYSEGKNRHQILHLR